MVLTIISVFISIKSCHGVVINFISNAVEYDKTIR